MAESVLDQAIECIADGRAIDWHGFDRGAVDRELLHCLRILHDIAHLHSTADDPRDEASEGGTASPADPQAAPRGDPPRTWGRYRLDHKVGQGSFGEVYRAWDPELEREVAVKILHRHIAASRLKERLLREGRALAKVRHAHVVSVFGVEAHEDRVGLCMEFIRGDTLADRVGNQGIYGAREAALIGEDLCRALAAVHRAGFVHRDVKAKNVMREQAGRIVLMDFGTGRAADNPELQDDIAGTPLYMAPEVLDGEPASACSDVYSVGVLLYFLVTAEYPVEANSIDELRDAHARRHRRRLSEQRPDLPLSFVRVVERALAPEPRERYQSAGALLEALGTVRGVVPIPTYRRILYGVAAAAALVAGLTALGAIVSTAFNVTLERSAFVDESWRDWFRWGRMAAVAPTAVVIITSLAIFVVAVLWRLLTYNVAAARRLNAVLLRHGQRVVHRLRLDTASVLAGWVLMLSGAALIAAALYFAPLLAAALAYISTAPAEQLALLSPDAFVAYHNQFRWIFDHVVLLSVVAWIPVVKLVRKGQSLHWGMLAGGALITGTALVLLQFPYRLLYFNDVFQAVTWNGARCYVIGERAEDLLLFCPEIELPRNRIVRRGDAAVIPLGITESIFSRFGSSTTAERGDRN